MSLAQRITAVAAASRAASRVATPAVATRAFSGGHNAPDATVVDPAKDPKAREAFEASWDPTRDSFMENVNRTGELGHMAYYYLKQDRLKELEKNDDLDRESNYTSPINETHFARKFNTKDFLINRYEIFKSNQREELLETMHASEEANNWLFYSKLFAPIVLVISLVALPNALDHEHHEHPAYDYLNIRKTKYKWGDESPFNLFARKLGMSDHHFGAPEHEDH